MADGRIWLVDADAIAATGALREGVALESPAVALLEASHAFVSAFDRALGMLARARRTRRELERRLSLTQPDGAVVQKAIERLETLGLLDDQAVARAEAASRFRRGEGAGRIRQSLARKGVARAIVDAAIQSVAAEEAVDDVALCRAAGEKRLKSLRSLAPDVQRRRLMGFLLRRGFSGYDVSRIVRELIPRERRGYE
jgi:regulatory protein